MFSVRVTGGCFFFSYHRYNLMLSCWDKSPEKRPTFLDLVSKLEQMMVPLANYMDFNAIMNDSGVKN